MACVSLSCRGIADAVGLLVLVLAVEACSSGDSGAPATQAQPAFTPYQSATPTVGNQSVIDVPLPPVAELACAPCKKIAFTSERNGNPEIYSVNADGTGLTRLTDNPSGDDQAAWSPDGRRIAFTRERNVPGPDLMVMNADGSGVVRIELPHRVYGPTWSPDGTKIAYSAVSDGSANVWAVDAGGGSPAVLLSAPGWDAHPAWSPDGRRLAVASDWFAYDFVTDVFLMDADGSRFTPLTDGNIFDRTDYLWPSWSPNGAKIATTISQEFTPNVVVPHIRVMNSDGSGLTPLIAAAVLSKSKWSPDGTMIAFTSGTAQEGYNVSWVKADGSAWGTIIANGWNADWQP